MSLPMPSQMLFEDTDRALLMRRAYLAYTGRPPMPLRRRNGEPDDNVILGYPRLLVDKSVSFLFGQDVTSKIDATESGAVQTWLDECWRRNHRMLTLQKGATNGGICGHAFWKILDNKPYPRVIVLDPQLVTTITNPDDCEEVIQYLISLPSAADVTGATVQRRQLVALDERLGTWSISDQHSPGGGVWITDTREQWSYPFSPIVDCQNLPRPNDFWGESDLPDDMLHMLQTLNRIASNYSKIIRLHAHPIVWARGLGSRTIDTAIDKVIMMPSETAELASLEMKSDLASTLSFLSEIKTTIAMTSRIPLVAMGQPDNLGSISGVALQIRFQPLIEKTETKRRTYGNAVQELDRRLLAMGGFGDQHITTLAWPELIPSDPLMERQIFVLDESLGLVSKQTLSEKLGYDYESELQLRQEDIQTSTPPQPPAPGASPTPGALPPPGGLVPPPQAVPAPIPDIAKTGKSK